jgi:2-keto-4-pentenoate hydratase
VVLGSRVHPSGSVLRAADFGRIGLEFEIGMRFDRDVTEAISFESVAACVGAVCPAFEVVDDRRADYAKLEVATLIADNAWNGGIVLGAWQENWGDLAAIRGVASKDGVEIDAGHGRDVLGHPFQPLVWLAEHLAEQGGGLKAGDVVLTGSLVTTRFPVPGERYGWALEGLGAVEVSIAG